MNTFNLRRTQITGMVLGAALVLAGCSDSSERKPDAAPEPHEKAAIYTQGLVDEHPASGDPVSGGTLTVAEYGEARSLDPLVTYANGALGGSALAAVYDTLMRYDYESKAWEPKLAESLTTEDNKLWTLKLREGVKFSDGTPLDADAVAQSMNNYLDSNGFQSPVVKASLPTISAADDLTVEVQFLKPWATFPAVLSGGLGMIVAPASYKDPLNFKAVGAGAFELDHYSPAEELVLKKRADYWDGEAYLDKLRFVWLGSDDAKLDSMNTGEIDSAFVRSQSVSEAARSEGYDGMMYVVGGGSTLNINMREGRPGSDVRVRKAIELAFDNATYLERGQGGAGIPSKSIFAETSPWATGVKYPEPDVKAAAKLVDEAKADGYDGKLSYLTAADPTSQNAAVTAKALFEAAGFDVQLESVDNIADMTGRIYIEKDFDLAIAAASIGDEDPYGPLRTAFHPSSPQNLTGVSDQRLSDMLDRLASMADDPAKGADMMKAIEERLVELVPSVNINPSGNYLFWQENVHGVSPTVYQMLHYDKAWMGK